MVPRAKPVDPVAAIKQLVLRMTGKRPDLGEIRKMESDAGTGEKGLLEVLRAMLNQGFRYFWPYFAPPVFAARRY